MAPRRFVMEGLTVAKLAELGGRVHLCIETRFITIIHHKNKLHAIDSPCYHAAGPLGEGPLVDIEEITCISCPWHNFLVDLETGEEITRLTRAPDFGKDDVFKTPTYPMAPLDESMYVPGELRRGARVQRIHKAEIDDETGEIAIVMEEEDVIKKRPVKSDGSACHPQRGAMSMQIRDIKSRGLDQ